ncbi:hypothetical protein HK097_008083 [Rhizophlyctis rosea]|uniref:Glycerophosphocholine acyltransferase 1 n=1 Tax=Rhizophlyctis rosea TaxID=64517 RepID=A0AAD5SDK5_9FUNG|nr:hypothetical protein HK097_008083 [Rhizophlyctis rosea]
MRRKLNEDDVVKNVVERMGTKKEPQPRLPRGFQFRIATYHVYAHRHCRQEFVSTVPDSSPELSQPPLVSPVSPPSPTIAPILDLDLDLDDLSSFDLVGSDWIRVLKDSFQSQRQKIEKLSRSASPTNVTRRLRSAAEAQRNLVHKKVETLKKRPDMVKTRDKVSFVLGVTNLWASAFLVGWWPDAVPLAYAVKIVLLLGTRLVVYRQKRWHYFMFDMCYYVNALLLAYLFSSTPHPTLLHATWGLANGPVLAAITAWRNSLVFHSLDKVTSLLIHFEPPMTLFVLRWSGKGFGGCGILSRRLEEVGVAPLVRIWDIMGPSLAAYVFWQAAYWVFVWSMKADKIKSGYATSTTYLLANNKSIVYRLTRRFGPALQPYMFMLIQLVFTIVTVVPTWFYFHYKWMHASALVLSLCMATYNGANYYFEVFSRRYVDELKGLEKQLQKMASGQDIGIAAASAEQENGEKKAA